MLLGAVFSAGAEAAPGNLDLTFSGDGKQRTDFGFGSSGAAATALQPDGRIVAVGNTGGGSTGNFALARYNPDGSLDTSFSGDGRQVTDFGGFDDDATGVAVQANGKIVVVGGRDVGTGERDFAIARYSANGSLDSSFSGDGKQTTDSGFKATGVALQADGKIVVVGGGALARYNPNGSLDTSFSDDGKQTTDFGFRVTGVALQADGKIVAAGAAGGDFALARYNPNGSLDTTFSGDGMQTTDFGGFDDEATAVVLQGDGEIVAAGFAGGAFGDHDFGLARYNPDGSLDTGFSDDGKQTTDSGFNGATGVALQNDGEIVAVGQAGGGDFALARYNPDGSLDTSFSGDGKQTTDFGRYDAAAGVALQGDGRIVAVGRTFGGGADFALARYNPDGSLDPSFSGDGRQTTDFGGGDFADGVALQGDGKIVAVGGAGGDFALARYQPNGTLDTTFSSDGRQTTDFGAVDGAAAVALQADGKIVAVGVGGGDFALARYQPNGTLDTTFSGDGRQTTDFGGHDVAAGVALQGDGRIVAVGVGGGDFALARYNPNGTLDPSFSGDGKQTTDFGGSDGAAGVVLQGGKIVAVGGGGAGFALARYNPNGSLDSSFSGDGKQTTAVGGGGTATGVALQGDGKIAAVGLASGVGFDFALARYSPNGSLDPSFSGDGKQTTNFGGADEANAVALQGGKIVAIGRASRGPTGDDFALARYNPDGSLDTSFSGDGKQTTNFGGNDQANGLAFQGDGKIVAVGSGLGTDLTSDFALARYLGG
jgi:uncharacterized delta-60 repeat protein